MASSSPRQVRWVASARADLQEFPAEVREDVGYALWLAQIGERAPSAKPLKGIVVGAGILEIVESHDGAAYRVVYTVSFQDAVYVLHAFQKKARVGRKTPKPDIALIRTRYMAAQVHYQEHGGRT